MAVSSIYGNPTPTAMNTGAKSASPPPDSIFGSGLWNELETTGYNQSNPYTNSAHDAGGRSPANIAAISLGPAEYYNLANQYGFYNSLQPEEHQAVMQYLNYLTNPTAATDEFRQQQLGQITGEAPAMQNALASAGAGQGAKEGAVASLYNNAQRSANEFDANWNSPQGKAQQAAGVVNLVNSQAPNWGNEQNIASITNNTPRNQTGLQAAMSLGQTAATVFGPKK